MSATVPTRLARELHQLARPVSRGFSSEGSPCTEHTVQEGLEAGGFAAGIGLTVPASCGCAWTKRRSRWRRRSVGHLAQHPEGTRLVVGGIQKDQLSSVDDELELLAGDSPEDFKETESARALLAGGQRLDRAAASGSGGAGSAARASVRAAPVRHAVRPPAGARGPLRAPCATAGPTPRCPRHPTPGSGAATHLRHAWAGLLGTPKGAHPVRTEWAPFVRRTPYWLYGP
ncbi:hypothetical protein ABZT43_00760 [Streptomyces sp. NPDC005349]|uniref:hypothetical protein n=1 Tax=Streptomyces sp. NPDC005349 TaxID=3157037 RepID=UPI0033A607AC